jgi:hypothetical protein
MCQLQRPSALVPPLVLVLVLERSQDEVEVVKRV